MNITNLFNQNESSVLLYQEASIPWIKYHEVLKSHKVDICSCWQIDGPSEFSRHSWVAEETSAVDSRSISQMLRTSAANNYLVLFFPEVVILQHQDFSNSKYDSYTVRLSYFSTAYQVIKTARVTSVLVLTNSGPKFMSSQKACSQKI